MPFDQIKILGTPVAAVDYETALEEVLRLAKQDRPTAVAAANTHIITEARLSPHFQKTMAHFDLIVPDGMPLVWTLRLKGKKLADRVYGPYLMQFILKNTCQPWRHFFFGGTEEILRALLPAVQILQPQLEIVGAFSPPFRVWTEADQNNFSKIINESKPDFIWVALGGVKQEEWIVKNQFRYPRGVFFAIGDAFNLLAGERSFAPRWMQRAGLTWLYRLIQEPARVGKRYLKYNALFLYYSLRDTILKAAD